MLWTLVALVGTPIAIWWLRLRQTKIAGENEHSGMGVVCCNPDVVSLILARLSPWASAAPHAVSTVWHDAWPRAIAEAAVTAMKPAAWRRGAHEYCAARQRGAHESCTFQPRSTTIALCDDGDTVATVGFAGDARQVGVWSFTRGMLFGLKGHTDNVLTVATHGNVIISGAGPDDATVRVWSVETREAIALFEGHTAAVYCVAVRDDVVVSGSFDCTCKVWSIQSRAYVLTFTGHEDYISDVKLVGNMAVSAGNVYDNTVRVWSVVDGAEIHCFTHDPVHCPYGLSVEGDTLATGCARGKVWLHSLATGTLQQIIETGQKLDITPESDASDVLRSLFDNVCSVALCGGILATGGFKTVKVWSIIGENAGCLATIATHGTAHGLAFAPRRGYLLVAHGSDDTMTGRPHVYVPVSM